VARWHAVNAIQVFSGARSQIEQLELRLEELEHQREKPHFNRALQIESPRISAAILHFCGGK
jgi:hypothetical protein